MPEPAGTGLSRRSVPLAQRRAGIGRLRRLEDPALGLRDRDRAGGAGRQGARLGLLRRRHRRAQRAGAGRRFHATRQLRPNLALTPETPAPPFSEDTRLQLAPGGGEPGDPPRRGQGQRLPGDRLRPPGPVALHLAPLLRGRRARRSASAPAGSGRYIDLVGDSENPLQGLSMDGSLSPMIATAEKPVAAIDSVDGYDLWAPVSDPIETEMYRSFAQFGALPADSPALAQVAQRDRPDRQAAPATSAGSAHFTSPVAYPDTDFAHKLAGLAAFIAAGLPMRVVTIRAAGGYDTHSDQAGDLRSEPARNVRGPARLPARPRGARPRRPGDDRDVERVRAPAGGERLGRHRPRRRRLRLRDRLQSKGRDGRRIPRARRTSTQRKRARHQRLPRRCTARCSSSGWARTPPRSSPAPPASPGRRW